MNGDARLPSGFAGLVRPPSLSRRTFLSAAAASAAGYTLAAGPVRAEAIKTDTNGLVIREETVKVAAGDMPVYSAKSVDARDPAVVLVAMEVFGLHEYIKDVVRRLAKASYHAVAPNYYFTKGDLTAISDVQQLLPLVNAKSDAELVAELDATADWAFEGKAKPLGIVGFCRGGRSVWIYCANSDKVRAGVAFYGSLVDPPELKALRPMSPIDLATEMKAPVLGLYGAEDQNIAVADVEKMKAALAAAGKTAAFKIYPGAAHGFHADYRSSYKPDAAGDAWTETLAWLKAHGVG